MTNPLDTEILRVRYADKPNLVTDMGYVLGDSAALGMECYRRLVLHSHTLNSLIRKTMMIVKLGMKLNLIKKAKEKGIINSETVLGKGGLEVTTTLLTKEFPISTSRSV